MNASPAKMMKAMNGSNGGGPVTRKASKQKRSSVAPKVWKQVVGKVRLREEDRVIFEKLCEIQCTKQEIQDWYGVTREALDTFIKEVYGEFTFEEVYAQKRGLGIISLRRSQFRLAQKNVGMAIFLGKQWLGQTDNYRQEITGKNGGPIRQQVQEHRIDWSKFSVDQLEVISGIMEQVNHIGSNGSTGRADSDEPKRAEAATG